MNLLTYVVCMNPTVGNSFAEDDDGRLFYIAGKVNERAAVSDEDKPLMTRSYKSFTLSFVSLSI